MTQTPINNPTIWLETTQPCQALYEQMDVGGHMVGGSLRPEQAGMHVSVKPKGDLTMAVQVTACIELFIFPSLWQLNDH